MHPTKRIRGSRGNSLQGKTIALGVTGSIAAVKCVELARELIRKGAEVYAVMSKDACRILHPNAMEYATGNPAITELTGKVEHVKFCGVGGEADLLLIAPCTANTIGKIVWGIDDTTVSSFATTALGSKKKILVVPAMHESMHENAFVAENLRKLQQMGISVLEPRIEEGAAKFPSIDDIVLECERMLSKGLLKGKKILVASGAAQEDIDPIRVLTNRASGKTGMEIAKECYRQQAEVCIIHNNESIARNIKNVRIRTGKEMEEAVLQELKKGYDLYITPAAITDFGVKKSEEKIRADKPVLLKLQPKAKLIELARERFPKLEIVAFKVEVGIKEAKMIEKARKRMKELNSKLLVANDVKYNGLGTVNNKVLIVSAKKVRKAQGAKEEIARAIVEEIARP